MNNFKNTQTILSILSILSILFISFTFLSSIAVYSQTAEDYKRLQIKIENIVKDSQTFLDDYAEAAAQGDDELLGAIKKYLKSDAISLQSNYQQLTVLTKRMANDHQSSNLQAYIYLNNLSNFTDTGEKTFVQWLDGFKGFEEALETNNTYLYSKTKKFQFPNCVKRTNIVIEGLEKNWEKLKGVILGDYTTDRAFRKVKTTH